MNTRSERGSRQVGTYDGALDTTFPFSFSLVASSYHTLRQHKYHRPRPGQPHRFPQGCRRIPMKDE